MSPFGPRHITAVSPVLTPLSLAVSLLVAQSPAAAQDLVAAQAIVVTGQAQARTGEVRSIQAEASSPRSLLTPQTIEQVATLTSDFGTLANLLPSFVSSAPNGNGFDAAKGMTLRGFADGQFNVTLDGIPFADPDGFGHHSTSILPASSIESLMIDRSPGSGTSLGYSTIGGSLNIASLSLPVAAQNQVYAAYGSFATQLIGVRLNSAAPKADGETGLLLNLQHLQTDGAMANNWGRRDDILLKSESRLAGLKLTLLYTYDDYHFINPPSVTTDQIAQQGSGVGLTTDVGTPLYNGYARTDRSAGLGYARLQGELAPGLAFTETLYTYTYNNKGYSVNGDVTLASSYQVGTGFGMAVTDIAGRYSENRYRTLGNIAQLEQHSQAGTLRAGLWLEHSHQVSQRNAIDLSTGTYYNANKTAGSSLLYDYQSGLDTVQPFAEFEWRATPDLMIKPGLRWQQVRRRFDANVVPNSRPGTVGEITRTVNATLPSLEANYAINAKIHAYGQLARGSLVPNQNLFYTATPGISNQAQPQTSRATQAGLIFADGGISASVNGYQIDLDNYISATTDASKNTVYQNNGRVRYEGVELEGNAALGHGFTAFANASSIRARYRDSAIVSAKQVAGDTIPLVPSYTGLLGALYRQGAWSGSLTAKFIGTEYQAASGSADGSDRRVSPYHYANLTLSRSLDDLLAKRNASLSLQVNNIENRTPVTDSAGRAAVGASGPLLVNVLARRNFFLQLKCDL
jgi:iron complex outermembrane receptor protein